VQSEGSPVDFQHKAVQLGHAGLTSDPYLYSAE
jgi:hypothetical protein